MAAKITKARALDAASQFKRLRHQLDSYRQDDLLMGWGRLYAFPPGTPMFSGPFTVGAISAFVLEHAEEIE
jgi:hypothetical protein